MPLHWDNGELIVTIADDSLGWSNGNRSFSLVDQPELAALYRFVKRLADMKICSDDGEQEQCYPNSGPSCGHHDNLQEVDITQARDLLAKVCPS